MLAAHSPFPRLVAWTLVFGLSLTGTVGCSAWKRQKGGVEALLTRRDPPEKVRITLSDGSRVEFRSPALRGDSLVGMMGYAVHHVNRWDGLNWRRSAVALADVRQVELRKFDAGRTLILAAVGVGATVAIVAIATADDPKPSPPAQPNYGGGSGYDGCFLCSCPLIYSWNGRDWVLDSGTFGGAFLRPLAYTDTDNLEALT